MRSVEYIGRLFVMAVLAVCAMVSEGRGDQLYSHLADTYVVELYPDSSSVNDSLRCYYDNGGKKLRALIRFDLRAYATVGVKSATLRLYKFNDPTGYTAATEIRRLTNDWTYNQCTWNNRQSGVAWSTAGGDYDATTNYAGTTAVSGNSPIGWYAFDLTELAQKWADGTCANFGVLLICQAGANGGPKFYSSRATDQALVPVLEVTPNSTAEDLTVLNPEADLFYDQEFDWICWSSETYLKSYYNNNGRHSRSLIRFDVGGFRNGTLRSATLKLYKSIASTGYGNPTYLYRVTNAWVNGQATWSHRNYSGGLTWSTAGGDYDPTPTAAGGGMPYGLSPTNWYAFDVTTLVAGWLDHSYANDGILLFNGAGANAGPRFYSADYSEAAYRPRLEVEYHVPPGTSLVIR